MKDFFAVTAGVTGVVILVVLLVLVGPVLLLWAINSLAEAGGSGFYVEHNIWNYFVAFVLLILVRGGSNGSGK